MLANNTPWLSAEETEMAQYRLVLSAGGHDDANSTLSMWDGAKLAAKDWVGRTACNLMVVTWLLTANSSLRGSSCSSISSSVSRGPGGA